MKNLPLKILALLSYLVMVYVNFLANTLPLNNRSTGAISDAYPNLFAPAGITFAIWGLIYTLLGAYVIFQFFNKNSRKELLYQKINPLFILTSIANFIWIFTWHYDFIALSVVVMITLLALLIRVADILRNEKFSPTERITIQTPFSVYFGWITVAAIANITVFLVSLSWNGFGIADYLWTSIILVVGALIGILRIFKDKQIAYGIVLIWAYAGILFKHTSTSGFSWQYPSVIYTVLLCLGAFIIVNLWVKLNSIHPKTKGKSVNRKTSAVK